MIDRVARQRQPLADLLRRQHAVEGREVLRGAGVEIVARLAVVASLGGATLPVERPAPGDRRGGDPLHGGEVLAGLFRLMELGERDPAGGELRVGGVGPHGQAAVGGRGIGGLGVAGPERREHQPVPLVPDAVALLEGRDLVREILHLLEGRRVLPLAAHVGGPLERDARPSGLVAGQGGHQVGGVAGVGAQRDPRLGLGPLVLGQQRDHVPRRRAVAAVEQDVGAPGVILGGQDVAEARQHGALRLGLETLVAPPMPDQHRGVLGPAQGLVGRGQRHGPLCG